jgi:hypothetical protein
MTLYDKTTLAILDWLAGLGAAGLAEVAGAHTLSTQAAATRLRRLETDGLLTTVRLLHGRPALHVITRAGLRSAGRTELAPPRVSSSGFAHLLECGHVAVSLQQTLTDRYSVHSERELRAWERAAARPLASAEIGLGAHGARELHRPDLVCWPAAGGGLAIAIEVELTVKAPQRLRTIVRAWARSRLVAGVVYYASAPAARALERAVADERAAAQVHLLPLALAGTLPPGLERSTSPIPRAL